MKKICIPVCLCLFLAACGNSLEIGGAFTDSVNDYEGVTMTAVDGTAMPGTVTIEILNTTDAEIDSGNAYDFALQVEQNEVWYALKRSSFVNTAEAIGYPRDVPIQQELTWGDSYGSLPEGHYRVIKSFFEYREDGDHIHFLLTAEFTLE